MERDAFLARVRDAVATAGLPDHPGTDPGPLVPDMASVDPVEAFTAASTALGGEVHHGDPTTVVSGISNRYDAGPYMAWDEVVGVELPGRERLDHTVVSESRLSHQQAYSDLVIGVTMAEAGFAETGSIVVRSGPGRPRMASLVPLVHVAVLKVADIHRSLSHWVAASGVSIVDATNVVVITGPSRTADIEQHITIGVHGPRHLHVVLVD